MVHVWFMYSSCTVHVQFMCSSFTVIGTVQFVCCVVMLTLAYNSNDFYCTSANHLITSSIICHNIHQVFQPNKDLLNIPIKS